MFGITIEIAHFVLIKLFGMSLIFNIWHLCLFHHSVLLTSLFQILYFFIFFFSESMVTYFELKLAPLFVNQDN